MSRARDVASNNLAVDTTPTLQGDLTMGSNSIADGVLPVKNNGTQSELRLYCEAGSHYVGLKSPAHSAFSGNHTITMPPNTGTSGQFLTTDGNGVTSWAAAGGGSWDLLNTVTANNVADVVFTSPFTSSYSTYKIICSRVTAHSNSMLFFERSLSGSASTYAFSGVWKSQTHGTGSSWTYGDSGTSNVTYYIVGGSLPQASQNYETDQISFELTLEDPLSATQGKIFYSDLTYGYSNAGGTKVVSKYLVTGFDNTTTAYENIKFRIIAGNISGVFHIYGIKNS